MYNKYLEITTGSGQIKTSFTLGFLEPYIILNKCTTNNS